MFRQTRLLKHFLVALVALVGLIGFSLPACTSAPVREPAAAVTTSDNQVTCGQSEAGGQNYRYCITRPAKGTTSKDVLYYLHGNGGNELSWDKPDHHAIESAWKRAGVQPPVIVTVSFGPTWFLTQEDGLFNGSMFDGFTNALIPDVEKRLGFTVARRYVMGESMGGFNTSLLYFKAPRVFAKYASLCPAILTFSPQASDAEVQAYIARHQPYVDPKAVEFWRAKMRKAFASADSWLDHNPLALAGQVDANAPPLFIMSDEKDGFGFHEAGVDLRERLQARKANVSFHVVNDGAHCQYSPEVHQALARFFTDAR